MYVYKHRYTQFDLALHYNTAHNTPPVLFSSQSIRQVRILEHHICVLSSYVTQVVA